jgi:hypothetical protein
MGAEDPLGEYFDPSEQQRISDAVQAISDTRAIIEQTKGMLMFVYGIDADAAFGIMKTQSQNHNVKLRLIAEQILKDLVELAQTRGPARRLAFDGLMLTAHQRVTNSAARQLNGECKTGVPMKEL